MKYVKPIVRMCIMPIENGFGLSYFNKHDNGIILMMGSESVGDNSRINMGGSYDHQDDGNTENMNNNGSICF